MLKLVERIPQTLRTLCKFDDNSTGWDSRQWDALAGASIPTNAHTLTEQQEKAVKFAKLNPKEVAVKIPKPYPLGS